MKFSKLKNIFLIFTFLTVISCLNVEAAEVVEPKWVKFFIDVPDDIQFDYAVSIELTNEENNETIDCKVSYDDGYILYQSLDSGNYYLSDVKVLGQYEGDFLCGYSKESFKITDSSSETINIPIIIEFYPGKGDSESVNSNYEDMTLEEILEAAEEETFVFDNSKEDNRDSYVIEEEKATLEKENEQKLSIEDKIIELEKEEQEAEELRKHKENDRILPSFVLMCSILIACGIILFWYKRKYA